MIEGLQHMDNTELALVARFADQRIGHTDSNDELIQAILAWMGKVVGCSATDPERIERAVLEWMADRWNIEANESSSTGEIERDLRVAIAEESGRHLLPFWQVGCAMARVGPEEALAQKLSLMEKAAARLMPSQRTRSEMRDAWKEQPGAEGDPNALLQALQPHLEQLKNDPDLARAALVLSLVVALADGRLGLYEENLYGEIASSLGMAGAQATALQRQINEIYWEKLNELSPNKTEGEDDPHQTKFKALKASHLTLEQTGIMTDLEDELQGGFMKQLHRDLTKDPAFEKGVESWNKTPLLWPLGYAAGLCMYFKSRLRADDHPGLVRVAYLAISRQHLMAAGEGRELTDDDIAPTPEHVGTTPVMSTVELQPAQREIRRIKLDP